MATHYLACDLGAESGRLIMGTLDDGKLSLLEIHRFPNIPLQSSEGLHWNIEGLLSELRTGLKKAGALKLPISSISTDSWGVDYVLFDRNQQLIAPTFHYRDTRTRLGVERTLSRVDWPSIFSETGIQFMPINTLYQLASEPSERLEDAQLLLGIGDAFNFYLSGVARAEESLASTFQCFNPVQSCWSQKLLDAIGVPRRIMPETVASGTRIGHLKPELANPSELPEIEVIATCSHDTGAAVAAIPAEGSNWAYLSSGTWSLMGVELDKPVLSEICRDLNFTNELGYGGTVRLLKNIVGLWLVQECRRAWQHEGHDYDYTTLAQLAADSPSFAALIDPEAPRFLEAGNMARNIADFCQETGQKTPTSHGAIIRCALESLALQYGRILRQLEQLTGQRIDRLHIVGGGSKNKILNQFAANATGVTVFAGPTEATAAGNILVQALALNHLDSLPSARAVVRNSYSMERFDPQDSEAWKVARKQFEALSINAITKKTS
ncbi:MAG: carbohydrate kinase [Verrucomicrobiales bacterium]|nr:carbohydrate kinase [Verrucomicrobiales bacterium]